MPGNPGPAGPNGAFGLDAKNLIVLDPNGIPSEQIIDTGDSFGVGVTVEFDGQLADWILGILGTFDIAYKYVSDSGATGVLGTTTVTTAAQKLTYSGADTQLTVPAGMPPGMYTIRAVADFGPNPVSAFANGLEVLVR